MSTLEAAPVVESKADATASTKSDQKPGQESKKKQRKAEPTARRMVAASGSDAAGDDDKRPIKMLHDRLLVKLPTDGAERRSSGGILIPATAQQNKRLVWGEVIGAGPSARTVQDGDQVLFSPEDRHEVEVHGDDYLILRERDVHAIAAPRVKPGSTGLYL